MFSHDIGIDLGTANTLVSVRGRGIVIDEPSVVAIDMVTKRVLALGGIVRSQSVRAAGDAMDQAIIDYTRQVHNMLIGERTAEHVKIEAGSAYPLDEEWTVDLRGRDLATGLPKSVEVSTVEIR